MSQPWLVNQEFRRLDHASWRTAPHTPPFKYRQGLVIFRITRIMFIFLFPLALKSENGVRLNDELKAGRSSADSVGKRKDLVSIGPQLAH